jgi:hypothetical protein
MTRIALIIACALALAACGKQGVLERPDPMFGKPAPTEPAPKTPAQ